MADIMATMETFVGKIPTEKEKRYDRQLRLWGGEGQKSLENAHVLIVNSRCGALGSEILKNLALPGMGRFTIVDCAMVDERDLGVNFFIDDTWLGKPRGEAISALVRELNPEVEGSWTKEVPHDLSGVTLIILGQPPLGHQKTIIDQYVKETKVPLVTVNSAGFFSYFHIQYSSNFPVVDTHPDPTAMTDLGIMTPWPELLDFQRRLTDDIENLSDQKHGHIPYLILLLHYLEEWKELYGDVPQDYASKSKFKQFVEAGMRTNIPEGSEENYDEAAKAVMKTIKHNNDIPSDLAAVFRLAETEEANNKESFWVITRAVQSFYRDNQRLPFAGIVPDMKAESEVYVELQRIYKARARDDADNVLTRVQDKSLCTREEVENYCKNISFLKVIPKTVLERDSDAERAVYRTIAAHDLAKEKLDKPGFPMPFYIFLGMRAVDLHDYSDVTEETVWGAVEDLLTDGEADHSAKIAMELSKNPFMRKCTLEVARCKGAEIHNTVALTGGLVAQEVIKLLTKQYVPVDNLCVWDGAFSRIKTYRLSSA